MKQFFKMFFASLLAIVVSGIVLFFIFLGIVAAIGSSAKSDNEQELEKDQVLVIDLGKRLHEQHETNSLAGFTNDASFSTGLYDALKAIHAAKEDKHIKGILLKPEGSPNGWATSQQLREALEDFKAGGKKIYAYGEGITQKDYYLASTANVLYLNPVGMLEVKGLASALNFYKGTLDKLGVQPEIFYAGKFKSATEPFRADKMSDANRTQLAALQRDIWAGFLQAAAKKAGVDTSVVNGWAKTGAVRFASDAATYKLVDGAHYRDELEAVIRKDMSLKETDKIPYMELDKYAASVHSKRKVTGDRIALLFAEGEIVDGTDDDYKIASEDFVKQIRKISNDDKVKAVVMRVNSPGGSALASEVILRELQLLKKKKPLIVSMGDVAASGGYYISCQADSIFAMPNTITGSIGVFSMMFNIGGLMKDKAGITYDVEKNAPYADFPNAYRQLTPDEAARMQAGVDTIYSTFKGRVSVGRRLAPEMVDSIAQGRVWTGAAALQIGLVDAMGDMERALKSAAAKAKLGDYQVVTYPEPVDKFESLIRRMKGNPLTAVSVKAALEKELGQDYEYYKQIQDLRKMNGRTQMAMPYRFTVE